MIDIKALNERELAKTGPIIEAFPWSDAKAYASWLVQTHTMVNHSTRLVALAGAYAQLDRNELHARFVDHSKEERGHQIVAVADLKSLGYELKDLPRLPQSEVMYQIQYYWIQHRGATSFFGYTLALESIASEYGKFIYDSVNKAHGAKASKFMKLHSEDDVEHIQKAYDQINKLNEKELELVAENLTLSSQLYRSMLTEVAGQKKMIKAA
jgi:hypothetical protein